MDSLSLGRLLRGRSLEKVTSGLRLGSYLLAALLIFLAASEVVNKVIALRSARLEIRNSLQALSVPAAGDAVSKRPNLSELVRRPLLQPVDKPAAAPTPMTVKKSDLALALIGTFLPDHGEAFAIIEDTKRSNQEVFNLGETIFGEAKLRAIKVDRVEIERNGQIEVLVLDEFAESKGAAAPVTVTGENQFVVAEREVDDALSNLPLLLTQARAVPYFKDGQSIGLRLFAIKSGSIFEKIGLRNGDVLRSVNGNGLGDITQAVKIFEQLKNQRSINVQLERGGAPLEFKYDIQ